MGDYKGGGGYGRWQLNERMSEAQRDRANTISISGTSTATATGNRTMLCIITHIVTLTYEHITQGCHETVNCILHH